jgi:hypothetical protein
MTVDWVAWARAGNLSRAPVEIIEPAQAHRLSYEVARWEMAVITDDGAVEEWLEADA